MSKVLLTTAYWGPVQYYAKVVQHDEVWIEQDEHYNKQSYRTRCTIYGANGPLNLSVPVKKPSSKAHIKEVTIDYDTAWRKMHWKSIESAYRSSAFFEFFEDELRPFYEAKYTYLLDFNGYLHEWVCQQLGIDATLHAHTDFAATQGFADFRQTLHPKVDWHLDRQFSPAAYFQVFSEKEGFIPNLSILDLLFNEGPNSLQVLEESARADAK
ncbi:MAG: WbqC family protein [Bacteroidota bacterium]